MRIVVAAVFVCGTSAVTHAGQTGTTADALATTSYVERIRAALERAPASMVTFDTLDETPRFRIVIREPQPCCALPPLDFSAGPVPPGGLYAFEQQQRIGPFVAQPLFVIDIMPLAYAVAGAFKDARRAHDRRSAHEEMQRDIAQYCAAQSNRGAGIQICDTSPATR